MSAPDIWPFHARAFLGDTEKMSAAETGAYIRLLIFYWHNRGLPTADDELRNISGMLAPNWKRSRAKIQSKFGKGWRHERADRDLAYVAKMSAQNRAKAKRRWNAVDYGEKLLTRVSGHNVGNSKGKHRSAHATAMPKENIDRLPSISSSPAVVDKSGQPSKAGASFHQHKLSKQQQAQQAWENDLLRHYGPQEYARAIDMLAGDPELVERATQSEIRDPGSGVLAAMLGLSVREAKP